MNASEQQSLRLSGITRDAENLRLQVICSAVQNGRAHYEFEEVVSHTKLLCVALGPRKEHGQIARDIKRRKAVQI
jgi:hypothetical protein